MNYIPNNKTDYGLQCTTGTWTAETEGENIVKNRGEKLKTRDHERIKQQAEPSGQQQILEEKKTKTKKLGSHSNYDLEQTEEIKGPHCTEGSW